MKQLVDKATFTMPIYLMKWLEHISIVTGYSKSNLLMQALATHLHKFETEGSAENSLFVIGGQKGCYDEIDHRRLADTDL